jgi:hypothetical protein
MNIPNNDVIVVINTACNLMECQFCNDISESIFEKITVFYSLLGYPVNYGVNTRRGGLDKSILKISYHQTKDPQTAAQVLEDLLHQLDFRFILWERPINYGLRKSTVLSEVFVSKSSLNTAKIDTVDVTTTQQYEVHFKHEAIAKKVASYFTNISIQRNYDQKGWIHFVIKSNLLSETVLLQILHDNNLPTNCYHYQEPNLASRELKKAIDKLLAELPTNKTKLKLFKASFQSKAVAERVASFFTNTTEPEKESSYFTVTHPLLSEETVLRILHLENLPIDNFAVKEIEM